MAVSDTSPASIAPLLLRNLITSFFIFADKSLFNFAKKYKLLEIIHFLLISSFLYFFRLIPSLFPFLDRISSCRYGFPLKPSKNKNRAAGIAELGLARALTQLLSIINHVPVNSRKYDVVRSLAEVIIDENHKEGIEELREVNRAVLSAAFDRMIGEIEGVMVDGGVCEGDYGGSPVVMTAVRWFRKFGRMREGLDKFGSGNSGEKMAAELLWLAEKMRSCGCGNEGLRRWAAAAQLGRLAVTAEPRLQSSLVKVAAFFFKQAKLMGMDDDEDEEKESEKQHPRQTKLNMLIVWLPLLCRGSIGIDAPVLSISERCELEMVLEETIGTLQQDEQEQVLALWLHHYTYSSSSDWPNLHASYARWCDASRKLLIHQNH